jgi:hypothetical protein
MNGYTVTTGYRSSARRLTVSYSEPDKYSDDRSPRVTFTVTDENSDSEDRKEPASFTAPLSEFAALVKFWNERY